MLSFWIFLNLRASDRGEITSGRQSPQSLATFLIGLLIFGQVLLGGLVASHYAGNVCPGFPLCHGKLFPSFYGSLGIQVIHRLGAYILTGMILLYGLWIWRRLESHVIRKWTRSFILGLWCTVYGGHFQCFISYTTIDHGGASCFGHGVVRNLHETLFSSPSVFSRDLAARYEIVA